MAHTLAWKRCGKRCESLEEQRWLAGEGNGSASHESDAQAHALQQETAPGASLTSQNWKAKSGETQALRPTATRPRDEAGNRDNPQPIFEHYQQEIGEDRRHERDSSTGPVQGWEGQGGSADARQLRSSEQDARHA